MLRRRKVIGWSLLALAIAWPLTLCGADKVIQEARSPNAHLEIQPARITWLPHVEYGDLILTVAGPGDLNVNKRFRPGEPLFFSVFDAQGARLPDGSYAFELRAEPQLDRSSQKRSLVQSGYFWVREGNFVESAATQPDTSSQGEPASGPSLDSIMTKDSFSEVITPKACLGYECQTGDGGGPLKFKDTIIGVFFDDVPDGLTYTGDWGIAINGIQGADISRFSIVDVTNTTVPLTIAAGAPDHSLYVRDNGNVGLGTSTPSSKLHLVSGAITIGGHSLGERSGAVQDLQVNSLRNTLVNVDSDNNSTNASFSVFRNGDLTQAVFVAREDNLVGINKSTPAFLLDIGTDATNGNGAHVTAAGVWTNGSSRVNKTNIQTLAKADAFAVLSGLEPVRYTGKNSPDGEEYVGFIAEDVPDLVAQNDRKSLSPMDIVAVLTKVVQELSARVAELEAAQEAALLRPANVRVVRTEKGDEYEP